MAETLQFIKDIKPELKEKMIYRRWLEQKYAEKRAQGWDKVHKAIKTANFKYLFLLTLMYPGRRGSAFRETHQ